MNKREESGTKRAGSKREGKKKVRHTASKFAHADKKPSPLNFRTGVKEGKK